MKALSLIQTAKLALQTTTQIYPLFRRPRWSVEQIRAFQLARVKVIINEARQHVPLYQTRGLPAPAEIGSLKDLESIPLLFKSDLLNASAEQITSRRFARQDLISSKSSGSTGKALDVYYDQNSYNLFIMAGLRLYGMALNYWPWYRQTYIYTSPYPLNSLFGLYPLNFISTLNPIEDTIEKMRRSPPDLLVCYPSHLRSIADRMKPADFARIRPQAINVNSEMSSAKEREYLARKFNSFVFDDYSSEELTRIASQCRELNYHIFDDINYIEIVDDQGRTLPDGHVGNIVGTNLHNVGMPFIRYNQGDRGSISSEKCACGSGFRILKSLSGRKNDAFTLSNGETISSGYLLDLTYGVFLDHPACVNSFCLVQETPEAWVLELVPGQAWRENSAAIIVADLKNKLNIPQVTLEPRVVKDVRKTQSGKANPIISLVKK